MIKEFDPSDLCYAVLEQAVKDYVKNLSSLGNTRNNILQFLRNDNNIFTEYIDLIHNKSCENNYSYGNYIADSLVREYGN